MRAADLDAQRLGLEAEAVAGRTRDVGEVLRHLLAGPVALGLLPAPLQVGDDAFERLLGFVRAHAVVVDEADGVLAGAVEQRVLGFLRQVLPLGVERELVVLAERGQRLDVVGRRRLRPWRDRAAAQGAVLVGDDEFGIDVLLDAEPTAFRTGAERVVEREQPRLDLRNGEARHRTGEFLGEHDALGAIELPVDFGGLLRARRLLVCFLSPRSVRSLPRCGGGVGRGRPPTYPCACPLPEPPGERPPFNGLAGEGTRGRCTWCIGELDDGEAVGELERGLEKVRRARRDVRPHYDAVTTTSMSWTNFLSSAGRVGDLVELAVDLDPLEALLHELGQFLAVLAFAPAHHRRKR